MRRSTVPFVALFTVFALAGCQTVSVAGAFDGTDAAPEVVATWEGGFQFLAKWGESRQ